MVQFSGAHRILRKPIVIAYVADTVIYMSFSLLNETETKLREDMGNLRSWSDSIEYVIKLKKGKTDNGFLEQQGYLANLI